jgi:hypothetical protein
MVMSLGSMFGKKSTISDFELYSSTLFVDRFGRPLGKKGWPLMTMVMLSGKKKVCLACESIVLLESVNGFA